VVGVRQPNELKDAFDAMAHQGLRAVITGIDPMLWNERKHMAELAVPRRIAIMAQSGEMTRDGLLFSYAAHYPVIFRRAAHYVDKILRGMKPQDIPVEQPTKFEFIVNLKTAQALGLTLPPMILFQADEVIR
jgi:putative ABC transport system substrate-binding protein